MSTRCSPAWQDMTADRVYATVDDMTEDLRKELRNSVAMQNAIDHITVNHTEVSSKDNDLKCQLPEVSLLSWETSTITEKINLLKTNYDSRLISFTEEVFETKQEIVKQNIYISELEQDYKSKQERELWERKLTKLEHEQEMSLTGQEIEKLKLDISDMSQLKNEIELTLQGNNDNLKTEVDSLKLRVRWLEVAITNVKDKYSECKESLRCTDSTIDYLKHSLRAMHHSYAGVIMEANVRESQNLRAYRDLGDSFRKMELLEADLANSCSQNDIAQTCITRGNDLLATYKNAVQELIAERQSTVELFQNQHFP